MQRKKKVIVFINENSGIMKRILSISILIITISAATAQDYNRGLGFRIGGMSGLTYKRLSDYKNALEGIVSFDKGGVQLTVLREFYNPILLVHTDQLFFYYGIGGNIGYTMYTNESYKESNKIFRRQQFNGGVGIDGIFGLAYHILKYPLVFSIDYKPGYRFYFPNNFSRSAFVFAFSIMYTL